MVVDAVRDFLATHGIAPCPIGVACSGGVDSTALLLAFATLRAEGFDVRGVHVNHRLRGAASDEDEAFLGGLCVRLHLPFAILDGTLDPLRVRDAGIEAAAREVRYARLAQWREENGVRFVATAHQKNDQAETVLMRLVSGGGLAALRGIHPMRADGFIRPLLDVTRAEIEGFLRDEGVTPRHDASNDDPRFLRNRIRRVVADLGAVDSLAAVASNAQRQWPLLERAIGEAERAGVKIEADATRFTQWPENAWLRQALLHRHIRRLDPNARDVSARDLERLAAAIETTARTSVTKHLELLRVGGDLVLRRRPVATDDFEVPLSPASPATIAEIAQTVRLAPATASAQLREGRQQIQLPHGAEPAFVVRNRRRGDRFQPLGLPFPKKLKDFLIDRKIAADRRDRLPLLVWNGEIAWIAGVEVSERFKVTSPDGDVYDVWLEGPGAAEERDHTSVRG